MKKKKLEKVIDSAFDEMLVPPRTFYELLNYIDYKFRQLIVK